MKTIQTPMDPMDRYGVGRIIVMREWWNLVIWINRLRIRSIGRKFHECLGMFFLLLSLILPPKLPSCRDEFHRKTNADASLFHSQQCTCADNRHDVGMQIVGQPARDICRHFVQRWNLLIRTKVCFPRLFLTKSCRLICRTTNGAFPSLFPLPISRNVNCKIFNFKVPVRYRFVGVLDLGVWVL